MQKTKRHSDRVERVRKLPRRKSREEVLRYLEKLAFYRPNDGIAIAFAGEDVDWRRMKLEDVAEFKRHANGTVEVKFIDRLRALELLMRLQEPAAGDGGGMERFIEQVCGGEES